jgi:hypothetical protein
MKSRLAFTFLALAISAFPAVADDPWSDIYEVLSHPRCTNCHVADDRPRWFDANISAHKVHGMNVQRGKDGAGFGNAGLRCVTCHQAQNAAAVGGPPGAPNWRLAPFEMAWLGKSSAQVCAQIKDPSRNGGRNFMALAEHVLQDKLVAWGWAPGGAREPAPGSAQELHDAILKWQAAGAVCPFN